VLLWEEPVTKEEVIQALVHAAWRGTPRYDEASILRAVQDREEQGSTFMNEGIALPHARLPDLATARCALGVTRKGITDVSTEKPVEYVFLSLTPEERPEVQIEILAAASRAFQDRFLLRSMQMAMTPEEVTEAIAAWENSERRS
jgi:mannitol/fructose-specific phosphotransferase system IIA component (Ntr-type)